MSLVYPEIVKYDESDNAVTVRFHYPNGTLHDVICNFDTAIEICKSFWKNLNREALQTIKKEQDRYGSLPPVLISIDHSTGLQTHVAMLRSFSREEFVSSKNIHVMVHGECLSNIHHAVHINDTERSGNSHYCFEEFMIQRLVALAEANRYWEKNNDRSPTPIVFEDGQEIELVSKDGKTKVKMTLKINRE